MRAKGTGRAESRGSPRALESSSGEGQGWNSNSCPWMGHKAWRWHLGQALLVLGSGVSWSSSDFSSLDHSVFLEHHSVVLEHPSMVF